MNRKHVAFCKSMVTAAMLAVCFSALAESESEAVKVKDYDSAFRIALANAQAGIGVSQHNACIFYLEAMGTPKDVEKAVYWCKKSALQGSTSSERTLGNIYSDELKDPKEAIQWYLLAAGKGDPYSQFSLGNMTENGEGVPKDAAAAAGWYAKAAASNTRVAGEAYYRLAQLHVRGDGVAKDPVEAVRLAQQSADRGNPWGQYYMGYAYLTGFGGSPVDRDKARNLLSKAAAAGVAAASQLLNEM